MLVEGLIPFVYVVSNLPNGATGMLNSRKTYM